MDRAGGNAVCSGGSLWVYKIGACSAAGKAGRIELRYEAQEEAYVERARRVLEEAGLDRAGVMLEYSRGGIRPVLTTSLCPS